MATKTEELIKKCEDLGIDTKDLTNNAQREAAIKAFEETHTATEVEQTQTGEETTEVEETSEVEDLEVLEAEILTTNNNEQAFSIDDVAYTFSERFPKSGKLQVDGKVYTKKELLNHEDVLEQLVVGNSVFIKFL